MLRLSKLTDYAVVVLIRLAEGERPTPDCVQTSPGLAAATGVPEPTVAKVLKALASAGLVASTRGARGGYRLLRPLCQVTVADVITAVDGPIALTSCAVNDVNDCVMEGHCAIRGHWAPINQAVRGALAAVTLADLVRPAAAAAPLAAPAPALAD